MLKTTFASVLVLLAAAPSAWAQGTSTRGMFGDRTLGGATSLSGSSGLGSAGLGGSGGIGVGGGSGIGGTAGQLQGSERFLRDNRAAGQFVGSDMNDNSFVGAQAGANGTGMTGMRGRGMNGLGTSGLGGFGGGSSYLGGMGGMGGMGGIGSFGGLGGFGGGLGGLGGNFGGNRNQRTGAFGRNGNMNRNMNMNGDRNRTVNRRTTLAIGFRYQPLPASQVQTRLAGRLSELRVGRSGSLQVELKDGVATLRGRVASQDERDLARRIARMEPGVQTVIDEMTVDGLGEAASSPSDRP